MAKKNRKATWAEILGVLQSCKEVLKQVGDKLENMTEEEWKARDFSLSDPRLALVNIRAEAGKVDNIIMSKP